jgi:hypothetical protein
MEKCAMSLTRTRFVRSGSDHPGRIYGAIQDITERKLVEEERERLILRTQGSSFASQTVKRTSPDLFFL